MFEQGSTGPIAEDGIELAPPADPNKLARYTDGMIAVPTNHADELSSKENPEYLGAGAGSKSIWTRKWLIIGGVTALVVIAAVVGGVVGSRKSAAPRTPHTTTFITTTVSTCIASATATPTATALAILYADGGFLGESFAINTTSCLNLTTFANKASSMKLGLTISNCDVYLTTGCNPGGGYKTLQSDNATFILQYNDVINSVQCNQ
ncbi:hypothetical protein BP6252_07554 [Coleophoma cylindrospora]|uniref:Uncharacterized protein n=1 Tax=Coleophoma cylindrospora TaxID=1849047 RepID=A0A3D8RAT0_9HELO|nr:hypothetical protein BP6252_07554 [Coleophoma cylindrospora]